jgi:hypothetical protein
LMSIGMLVVAVLLSLCSMALVVLKDASLKQQATAAVHGRARRVRDRTNV